MTVLRCAKMLIDTHAHLTDEKFLGLTDDIIKDLENQKVEKVFCMATDKKSIEDVFEDDNTPDETVDVNDLIGNQLN